MVSYTDIVIGMSESFLKGDCVGRLSAENRKVLKRGILIVKINKTLCMIVETFRHDLATG